MTPVIEEWRVVPDTADMYEVSSLGRIRSWSQVGAGAGSRLPEPRVLAFSLNGKGYCRATLSRGGVHRQVEIHREINRAFNGEPLPGQVTRHLDGNKINNVPSNLAWGTQRENILDKILHGTSPSGERNPKAKLTEADVRLMRTLHAAGHRTADLAQRFGISISVAGKAISGFTWGTVR